MSDPNDLLSSLGLTPQIAAGTLGLGLSGARGIGQPPGSAALQSIAQPLAQQGQQLRAPLTSGGPLPPGAQAIQQQGKEAGEAAVRSGYSRMGLSGSTMEAQAMRQVEQQSAAAGFKMTETLFADGLKMSGMSAGMFSQIMQANTAQDEDFMKAISYFAQAAAGA